MGTRVTLPPGCYGLDGADGSKTPPGTKPGSSVEVSERHARDLKNSWYGETGTITATGYSFGTKTTRRCTGCGRDWNAWTTECHSCHAPTELAA